MSFPPCPCCGQPWQEMNRIRQFGTVVLTDHGHVELRKAEAGILAFLMDRPMRKTTLFRKWAPEGNRSMDTLKKHIHDINRNLRRLDWEIRDVPPLAVVEVLR